MSAFKSKSSVSNSVNLRYGRGFARKTVTKCYNLRDGATRQQQAYKKFRERVAGLSYEDQEDLMAVDPEGMADVQLYPIPLGEEGVLASHEGGEDELCREIFEEQWIRRDQRTRRDRTDLRNTEWALQLAALTDAYLAWKHPQSDPPPGAVHPLSQPGAQPLDPSAMPPHDNTAFGGWTITVVTIYDFMPASFVPLYPSEPANVTLARHGYLGNSPAAPSLALSFRLLECYRQFHAVCPRLSVQAFCQGLCGLQLRPFIPTMAEQFSNCFDVYLDILHSVDVRVMEALGRNQPEWRMRNACAPCLYILEDEPTPPVLLATMDGNSSLKLVDDSFRSGERRIDRRTTRTDVYLTNEEVDCFKDEVRDAQQRRASSSSHTATAAAPTVPPEPSTSAPTTTGAKRRGRPAKAATQKHSHGKKAADGDVSDSDFDGESEEAQWINEDTVDHHDIDEPAEATSLCAERWRNAGPEARKKMFTLFKLTGIFTSLCRHGQVLVLCDMVRSGELMKYPLAIVNKLLDVYGNDMKIILGYDIGCEFAKILDKSSIGPRAKAVVSSIVPAFHGHSHNRACQLDWHPMYRDNVGKEDFEGNERFFSSSNSLASGTRLSSDFHRHQAIEGHIKHWNHLKHAESGKFIFNNYRQALQIIEDGERALGVYERDLKITADDFERYLREERQYLRGLKSEPAEYTLKLQYIQALQKLAEAGRKDAVATDMYKRLDELIVRQGITKKEITKIHREYTAAPKRVQQAEEEAHRFEDVLGLDARWLPSSQEFKDAVAELGRRKYRLALDNLERLVVQRLFELNKLGLNGVGYKLRDKIGKALKARAEAIRKALAKYNRYAAELKPPKPELSLNDVMELVSLGEFDLLRETRQDIREQPWAQRTHRDAMNVYFNVKRAREEVSRLNLEIARLFSAMVDNHVDHRRAALDVRAEASTLASELTARQDYLNLINEKVVGWLLKTSQLPGFSGKLKYGHRLGRDKTLIDGVPLPPWAAYSTTGSDSAPGQIASVQPATVSMRADPPVAHVSSGSSVASTSTARCVASTSTDCSAARTGVNFHVASVSSGPTAASTTASGSPSVALVPSRDAGFAVGMHLTGNLDQDVGMDAARSLPVESSQGIVPTVGIVEDIDDEDMDSIPGAEGARNSGRLVKFFDSLGNDVESTT